MARHTLALFILMTLSVAPLRAFSQDADPVFQVFLEPFGSDSTGSTDFIDAIDNEERLSAGDTILFDDLGVFPNNEVVMAMTVNSVELALFGNTNRGAPFIFHPSSFYHWEGQMYEGTLVMGSEARMTPLQSGRRMGAVGFWIFDDGNLRDAIYRVDVTDACGNTSTTIVENNVPRIGGYEVEGFFGIVSTFGIADIRITSLDSLTGEVWSDPFEIDYLTVARLNDPRTCPTTGSNDSPPNDNDNNGTCTCSCRHCRRCDGDSERPGRGCGRGRGNGSNHRNQGNRHGRGRGR